MVSIATTTKRIIALGTLVLGTLTLLPTAAGAQDGCGTHSFGLAGTRLLNDGISDSAGPFAIDLPAGTYDVTLVSHDFHSEQPDPTQTEEQWYVQLDGAWNSPITPDLADDQDHASVTFPALTVPAATQIAVHHRGVGGVNSIDVVCVGFSPVDVDEPVTEIVPPVDPILPDPPADLVPQEEPPAAEIVPPIGPIVMPPADTPPQNDSSTPVDDAPGDDVEIAGPNADLAPPVVPVEPEVLGEVEVPAAPELALTGPNDLLWTLTFGGLAMVLLGSVLVAREQRIRA